MMKKSVNYSSYSNVNDLVMAKDKPVIHLYTKMERVM